MMMIWTDHRWTRYRILLLRFQILTLAVYAAAKEPQKSHFSILANVVEASNMSIRTASWNGCPILKRNTANSAKHIFDSQNCIIHTCLELCLQQFSCVKLPC